MDTVPEDILLLPEVFQVLLDWTDDTTSNSLRCTQKFTQLVDSIRTANYWRRRALSIWAAIVPDDTIDWFAFYAEVKYANNQHQTAGMFLTMAQLTQYFEAEALKLLALIEDEDEYGNRLYEAVETIFGGVILTDDVIKYQNFQEVFSTLSLSSITVAHIRTVQENICQEVVSGRLKTVLASNGGWNILCSEIRNISVLLNQPFDDPVNDLMLQAVKSNDIRHYLLVKALIPAHLSDTVDTHILGSVVFESAPQNIRFYWQEFPEDIEDELRWFLEGDWSMLEDMEWNKHTKWFTSTVRPYIEWSNLVIKQRKKSISKYPFDSTKAITARKLAHSLGFDF